MAASPDASADPLLTLVQRHSLTRLVADAVDRLIVSGELAPGAKLNEAALAARLGVSRGPLREAFRLLEESSLIRQEQNRGAFVRVVSLDEAAELYEVRAGLEAVAGRLLATRIDASQIARLRRLCDDMQAAAERADVDAFHALNLLFHDEIVAMCANRSLLQLYRKLFKQLTLFRHRKLRAPHAVPHFAGEHRAIVEQLARGDAEGSAQALLAHAEDGRRRMLAAGPQAASEAEAEAEVDTDRNLRHAG